MRTRCPACGTVFRVTSEQLRRKAGKVRCGHCQSVFNAFDEWQAADDDSAVDAPVSETGSLPSHNPSAAAETLVDRELVPAESQDRNEELFDSPLSDSADAPDEWLPESNAQLEAEEMLTPSVAAGSEPLADSEPEPEPEPEPEVGPGLPLTDGAEPVETPEESTVAAREAGLVAARELSEASGYNRWAAGTLAGDGLGGFGNEPVRRAVWPFVLVAALLLLTLCLQLLYHFRTEVVLRVPATAGLYELAAIDIPLPRNPALVSIETSDLQSDNARGLFVLQATLKNGAAYAQAWPALELSLTDTNDSVVSRRVMYAADYLPPGTSADSFAAHGEVAVQLWIEARNIGASGYRLYLFYP
jgi:predicted Zn finger-like uncharacterized protein